MYKCILKNTYKLSPKSSLLKNNHLRVNLWGMVLRDLGVSGEPVDYLNVDERPPSNVKLANAQYHAQVLATFKCLLPTF